MPEYDFVVPDQYKGQRIRIRDATLIIPNNAWYIVVNPLEDEEEFLGFQGDADRQQIIYYDEEMGYVGIQDFETEMTTCELMYQLQRLLQLESDI